MSRALLIVALLLFASCKTMQSVASSLTGGLIPPPGPESAAAAEAAWSAWLTWLGTALGITDPQAATAVTVAAYSRADNAVKGIIAAAKGTKRVVARRKKKPHPPTD